jgi:BolA protein
MDTLAELRQRLEQALAPSLLEISDQSQQHAGHASAQGGGHYTVVISCAAFADKSLIQRHRLVYDAAGDLMDGAIHALSIQAKTPE